jgi:hypothetical protein
MATTIVLPRKKRSVDPEDALEESGDAEEGGIISYTASLVIQGNHRFYTLSMPSDVLAATCFVDPREEDPVMGFQRVLDEKRAMDRKMHRQWLWHYPDLNRPVGTSCHESPISKVDTHIKFSSGPKDIFNSGRAAQSIRFSTGNIEIAGSSRDIQQLDAYG